MKPPNWPKVEELYHAALERQPAEREAFLDQACGGDSELRREVQSLLGYERDAERLLEQPAASAATQKLAAVRGTRLGPYEVIELIGAGGMGEVYRARDTRLGRDVAIKVLPPARVNDEEAHKRLVREAQLASRLNHPHVCTIYEVGEAEGRTFVAMELVEGRSLSALVSGEALAAGQVLRLGQQMADALAHAHEHGVVHRDFKSANVVITPEGRAKVLDFGLAKRLAGGDASEATTASYGTLTAPGAVAGTLAYMAPEQLRGKAADARSDIWALGVVLYEMASGRRPFQGQTGFALSAAILNEPPPVLPAAVADGLRGVVERCLAKEPGQRYQRAAEVRAALEALASGAAVAPGPAPRRRSPRWLWLGAAVAVTVTATLLAALVGLNVGGLRDRIIRPAAAPQIQSLAVLPLANLSGDPEQEYFADGMTEELITNLAKIGSLKVISRTSMMQYRGTKKPLPQIAKELNVDALIEGSVLREGGQVRITAQLIQAATDQHLWAESYQRDLRGVLALQAEIAGVIAGKVRAALTPAERAQLASARTVDPEAYEAYLKGMQHSYRSTAQDTDTALEYFELALRKDPNYAAAYAAVAVAWGARATLGYTAPNEAVPKAKAAALKAIELDNTRAEAHVSLGTISLFFEWDWAGAEAAFKKAIELNPNDSLARAMYSHYLVCMKRPGEGLAEAQRAVELDPFNAWVQAVYAEDLMYAGRYDEAIAQHRKALRTSPGLPWVHSELSGILFSKAMYEESLAEARAYYAGDREMEEALTQGYRQSGYSGAMRRAADILAARSPKTYVVPLDVATLYVRAGEEAQALAWLEKAVEVRDPNMRVLRVDPAFETLRNTPRFQALLRRMNLPP